MATACARCAGYYGRRCGLGLGTLVARLFKQKPAELYLRTPAQVVYVLLFLVAMLWPIAGSALLVASGSGTWSLVQLIAAVALLLAFAVPHPTLVCRHCKQGACGACPVGKRFHAEGRREK